VACDLRGGDLDFNLVPTRETAGVLFEAEESLIRRLCTKLANELQPFQKLEGRIPRVGSGGCKERRRRVEVC
jgi:hypothetical protein